MLRYIKILSIMFAAQTLYSQHAMSPLNAEQTALVQAHYAKSKEIKPTGFAPYLVSMPELDSIYEANTKKWTRKKYDGWVMRKMKNEHLFEVHTGEFHLQGDAAFNLEASLETDATGRRLYTNTRGYNFNGFVGKRIFFQTSFYETQSIFPNYMDSVVSSRGDFNELGGSNFLARGAVPGYGRWKPFTRYNSNFDYDYSLATGTFGVMIAENSFLQFGHDKQFVGYGYRSVLLSDATAPYPFLRAQLSFWKNRITYTTTYAVLQSLDRIPAAPGAAKESPFTRLGARFSYLSFQPVHWFGIGLFDGTTWAWRNNNSPRSIEYYSPHAFLYTGASIRNQIVGLNGKVTILGHVQGYGQLAMNRKGGGRAAQVGIKVLGPLKNMTLMAEYNRVGQNFYFYAADSSGTSVIEEPLQEGTSALNYYQNADLVLGHPFGVAMEEIILRGQYRLRDVFVNGAVHITNFNSITNPRFVYLIKSELGYVFNPKSNTQLLGGIIYRDLHSQTAAQTIVTEVYPYVAFRTNLFNRYMDF